MTARKIGIGIVLLAFGDLTAYAVYQHGVAGVVQLAMANSVPVTAFADLVIALSLIVSWMWRGARERGVWPVPQALRSPGRRPGGPPLPLALRRGTTVRQGLRASQ